MNSAAEANRYEKNGKCGREKVREGAAVSKSGD